MGNDLFSNRMAICKQCLLFKENGVWGPECDGSKWINPEGTLTSVKFKEGWTRGCGCKLNWKCKQLKSKCILGKW